MSLLSGKHVIVTGGGSGVGAEIAAQFAAANAHVSILGRRIEPLEQVAGQIGASAFTCDVTDRQSVETAVANARQVHGAVDIAIANAGSAVSKPFADMLADDMRAMIDVNLLGVFNLWQVCLDDMKSSGWGRMLTVASTAGLKAYPYVSGYCAAKHAVVGLTRSVALDLARTGITVNAICPGFVETPMLAQSIDNIVEKTGMSPADARKSLSSINPMKRFIQVEEVAAMAMWLSGDQAASINGQALSINGGEQ